jgi:NnrS protein
VCELLLARPPGLWPGLPDAALHLGAIHLLTVGWLLQLITGVAFWMFPRHPTAPPRGDDRPGWAGFGLLNLGLLLRLVGEPWRLNGGPQWPLIASAVVQLGAVLLIVRLLWPRIREPRI